MINEKLLELRKSNNLTQKELAEKLHVSRQTISRWEVGTTLPDIEILKKLSILYGISLDEITNSNTTNSSPSTYTHSENQVYINAVLLVFATVAVSVLPFISVGVASFTFAYLLIHRKKMVCKLFIFITILFVLIGTRNTFIEIKYWTNQGTTVIEQIK